MTWKLAACFVLVSVFAAPSVSFAENGQSGTAPRLDTAYAPSIANDPDAPSADLRDEKTAELSRALTVEPTDDESRGRYRRLESGEGDLK
jgi:hypothetical protein